jgi:hypothetical protein
MRHVQLLDHAFDDCATITQVSLELAVTGFVNLMQQMLMVFLQEFPEQLFFLVGQPQFHGDLQNISTLLM